MGIEHSRRQALRLAAALGLPAALGLAAKELSDRKVRAFRLIEAAGFRRASYPIHATVEGAGTAPRFLLLQDGKPIEAQFRVVVGPGGRHDVALDFDASLEPFESRRYEVHYGLGVEPGPEARSGMKAEKVGDGLRVAWPGGMAFELGPDLHAPFHEAGKAGLEVLRTNSSAIALRAGEPPSVGREALPGRVTITREGPLAIGVRVESAPFEGGGSAWIDLTFPRSRTWMEATLDVARPEWAAWDPKVALALAFEPTAGEVRSGPGWARVADDRRSVTAAATGPGKVSIEPGGRVVIGRDRGSPRAEESPSLAFRVSFEPRSGPAGSSTGPESMIQPPRIEWDRPKDDR